MGILDGVSIHELPSVRGSVPGLLEPRGKVSAVSAGGAVDGKASVGSRDVCDVVVVGKLGCEEGLRDICTACDRQRSASF